MSNLTTYKTVNVTNPKNILVQIPSYIAGAEWGLKQGDNLEVLYDNETKEVTIRPVVLGRGRADEEGQGMARASAKRWHQDVTYL